MISGGMALATPLEPTTARFGAQSMIAPLRRALVHGPGPEYDAESWSAYGLPGVPDREAAAAEHSRFLDLLTERGVERKLLELDIPIIGWVGGEGTMDAGDTLWLDRDTLLVGRSYRSNDEGFRQLRRALDGIVRTFHRFELQHWEGPEKVLHLMSVVSLVDEDLAVVYPRAMPIRLRELLLERGYRLVEGPDEEV